MNKEIEEEFLGYSLFNEVVNPVLRARNRLAVSLNIKEDFGYSVSKDYLKHFNKADLISIYLIKERV